MPTPKKPKLTMKQAKFVKGIAEGKPNYVAALEAYDTDDVNVANVIAVENLQKPTVKEALDIALDKLGITPERILQPIDDALNDEDVKTRLMGTDRALKVMGITNKSEAPVGNTFIQINNNKGSKYAD